MSPAARQAMTSMLVPVVLALLSLVVSATGAFHSADKSLTSRIVTVETRQDDDRATLKEIKGKVDAIYDILLRRQGVAPALQ